VRWFFAVAVDSNFHSLLFLAGGYDSCERNEQSAMSRPTALAALLEEASRPFNRSPEPAFAMKNQVWRAVIEVGFIIFLFYANLLMGEFERSGMGLTKGMAWAIRDVLTVPNFEIALIAACIGYVLFEFLRKKF
jgi:hypothetical protein